MSNVNRVYPEDTTIKSKTVDTTTKSKTVDTTTKSKKTKQPTYNY